MTETNLRDTLGLLLCSSMRDDSAFSFIEAFKYIQMGANVNYRFAPEKFNETPLHIAAYGGDLVKIQMLVEAGCEMNPVDVDGRTPLDYFVEKQAVENCNDSVVLNYLVKYGAKSGKELGQSVDVLLASATQRSCESGIQGTTVVRDFAPEGR